MAHGFRKQVLVMAIRGWLAAASAVLALGAALPAGHAGEVPEAVLDAVRSMLGEVAPEAMREAPLPGFYEVRARGEIFYVSADGRHLFHGNLYGVEARRNLTEDARREVRVDVLRALDEDELIVFAPAGAKKHRLTVFTDVDCPYCSKFHLEVPDLNGRGVEVRYAAWPRTPPGTESHDRSISVWCARDQHQAMTDAKAGRAIAHATCDNPVQEHYETGRRLGVSGTPTLFTEDGERIGGYLPWRELVSRLDQG